MKCLILLELCGGMGKRGSAATKAQLSTSGQRRGYTKREGLRVNRQTSTPNDYQQKLLKSVIVKIK